MSPGQTGFVPGTKWVCPRDKPRFSSYFTQRKPSLSLGQTQFVPGTFRGRRAADRVYVLKVYVPFSFPIFGGFVRNFGRVFAILFEALLIEIQEEIPHFAGWEGVVNGHKNCEQNLCEQTGVS